MSRRLHVAGLIGLLALISLAALLLGGAGAGAQTSVRLANNSGEANGTGFRFSHDFGQSFTTGSDARGYKLTQLKLEVRLDNPNGTQPTYKLELWSIDSNRKPKSKLATLTNPAKLTNGERTWTFPGTGYDVKANTTYVVICDVHDPAGSVGAKFSTTASNSEEQDTWRIGNTAFRRLRSETTWGSVEESLQMKVYGYSKQPPTSTPTQAQQPQRPLPPPDPPNLARGAIQPSGSGGRPLPINNARAGLLGAVRGRSEPSGRPGIHAVPVQMSEIKSNRPVGASGSLDLRRISASVSDNLRRHSRGFYLTVMVERVAGQRSLFRSGTVLDGRGRAYELAHRTPLLKVSIWHVYFHTGRGMNSVELLGEAFRGRAGDRLVEPAEVCLAAPSQDAEQARIAVRGRYDRHWTILDSFPTFGGEICAETTRVAWFTIVLDPELD
ncbi:MAG: hypothetical protein OXH13_00510 [Chloroflexi bacterium]|nr:hypothetical protein [Chloroflexota bacterium]MCY3697116.1 hypothetical protein [Chloroflexota bacterium]